MHEATRLTAVVGTSPTDEPFGFGPYLAIATARDHLGPVTVEAEHLPYGVWWDRLRPTIDLVRTPGDGGRRLDLDGAWDDQGRHVTPDQPAYAALASAYGDGRGLF